ncbi:MAG: peptidase, partial [Longimicrobiales bacterium]
LTEMIGSPTPMRIPFVARRQLPSMDLAYPIEPQEWHMRQSIDYSMTLNRAVLDYASRMRENLLYNIYVMGRSSIERGSGDYWTTNPKRLADVTARFEDTNMPAPARDSAIMAELRRPGLRDPRGYIIPADQPDFATATTFINALRETGNAVDRASRDFTVNGTRYPAGSFVVMTAQAFRPHVIDMFEPQVHPDVFPVPGGPPTPPYDNAGWTLALQMGVHFDRILDGFTGPFERVTEWNVSMPPGRVTSADVAAGFLVRREINNSFIAVNRLLADGADILTLRTALDVDGVRFPPGTFYVTGRSIAQRVAPLARELGVDFAGVRAAPPDAAAMRAPRIGLWDRYGGSMDAGWARWILEQFEFPFSRVFAQELDSGDLNRNYDVLIFVGGGIPGADADRRGGGPAPADVPEEYRAHLGQVTHARTLPRLQQFVENGGTIVAIGSSAANLADYLQLPLENHLTEDGAALPRTKYYVPGSLLDARVDTAHPLAHGSGERTTFFFDNSPVFRLNTDAGQRGVTPIAWFDSVAPLRSGWAWGQHYLEGGVAAVDARVGRGRVILYGPEILKRAQPRGTFRFLFNAIHSTR